MKRSIKTAAVSMLAVVLLFGLNAPDLYAQGNAGKVKAQAVRTLGAPGTNGLGDFIDLDGDGICDNFQSGRKYLNRGNGAGLGFVDADGDGICDNAGSGLRQGRGRGRGMGQGLNGVDMSGTGVCNGTGLNSGNMMRGRGRRGGR